MRGRSGDRDVGGAVAILLSDILVDLLNDGVSKVMFAYLRLKYSSET
jgi:hypothetical protein